MSTILKAHTNKYRWLASALESDDTTAPPSRRYIVVLDGKASASNGPLVHIIREPELENGLYKLNGLSLKKVGELDVPTDYHPYNLINEIVFFNQQRLKPFAIKDLKLAYSKTILANDDGGCLFNRELLLKATNHSERNVFEVMAEPSLTNQSFAFGVNEFGTFFLVGLNKPNLITRFKLLFFGSLLLAVEKADDFISHLKTKKSKKG